jgi:hypothetical protein
MPLFKTAQVLANNTVLVGFTTAFSSVATTTFGWVKMIHVKLTNTDTLLCASITTKATVQISPDNSNWYDYRAIDLPLTISFCPGSIYSEAFIINAPALYIRVFMEAGIPTITFRVELTEVSEIARSVTSDINTLVPVGDDATQSQKTTGNTANDTPDSGNPVKIGGKAKTTNPTKVSDADRVDGMFDVVGRQVNINSQVRELMTTAMTTITSSTTETTILAAGAAGVFNDITHLSISNDNTITDTRVDIRDSTGGTIRLSYYVPAKGTIIVSFNPPFPQATAANNWTAQCGTSVANIYITVLAAKNV